MTDDRAKMREAEARRLLTHHAGNLRRDAARGRETMSRVMDIEGAGAAAARLREADRLELLADAIDAILGRLGGAEAEGEATFEPIFSSEGVALKARQAIAEANNSLYGSHGFFLSTNGGEPDKYHLARPIEDLKARVRELWRENQQLATQLPPQQPQDTPTP